MKVVKILIIDDDSDFQKELSSCLRKLQYSVTSFANINIAVQQEHLEFPDLIILNPLSINTSIEQNLTMVKDHYPNVPFMIIASQDNFDVIVSSMSYGAIDYLTKPTNSREIQILLHRIVSKSSIAMQIQASLLLYSDLVDVYEQQLKSAIVAASPDMMATVDKISKVAGQDGINVLIMGEMGVGKELVARGIHSLSKRRNNVFIKLDCSAYDPSFLESEIFGHTINPRTGRVEEKTGLLEAANDGVLYIHEVTELPLNIQYKLKQAITNRKFKKTGSEKSTTVNICFMTSTCRDKSILNNNEIFLRKLYESLNDYQIDIAPLRDRKEDILLISKHFVKMYADINQRTSPNISSDVQQLLLKHSFPGNVSELRSMIRKAMILSDKDSGVLYREDFPDLYIEKRKHEIETDWQEGFRPLEILDETEKYWILHALNFFHNNKTHVAKALKITRQSLNRRIEKHKIDIEIPNDNKHNT